MTPPSLTETFNQEIAKKKRENPEKMSGKDRILYEIEKILGMKEKDLELDELNKRQKDDHGKVTNQDLYKILKAASMETGKQPVIIYTGNNCLQISEAEEIVENTDRSINDLEVSV